jgi:hypothetical protein
MFRALLLSFEHAAALETECRAKKACRTGKARFRALDPKAASECRNVTGPRCARQRQSALWERGGKAFS